MNETAVARVVAARFDRTAHLAAASAMVAAIVRRPMFRHIVRGCERGLRWWRGVTDPAAQVGPVLAVVVRRNWRTVRLSDGTIVRPGERIGVVHVNNARIEALHQPGASPGRVGLQFRRQVVASLRELIRLSEPSQRLACVRAFCATTVFHGPLRRGGFERVVSDRPGSRLATLSFYAVLAALHPQGLSPRHGAADRRVERVWISRERLRQSVERRAGSISDRTDAWA